MPIYSFTDDERRHLEYVLRMAPNPHTHPVEALIFARRNLLANSPEWLTKCLHQIKLDATAPGWLQLRNGPIGQIPATPINGDGRNSHSDFVSQSFLLGAMQELGLVLTNRAEKHGNIPADITPIPGMGSSRSNAGFSEPLGMHTENVHLPEARRPNYVGLYTLRGDPAGLAETLVAEASKIVAALDPDTIAALRAAHFTIPMSESFKNGPVQSGPMPVLSGPEDLPRITTEFNVTRCLNDKARVAFEKFREATERVSLSIRLETGDLLITCNRRTIHGRGRFSPDFSQGKRRWLLRVCTVADLFDLRDQVAPGANRAFDITATDLRDMIAHCSGVLDIPKIDAASIPMEDVRNTIRSYDAWINATGVPSSLPDFPAIEMILFVARSIVQGSLVRQLPADERLRLALVLTQHALLEANLSKHTRDIDMHLLAEALTENASFSDLLRTCLSDTAIPLVHV